MKAPRLVAIAILTTPAWGATPVVFDYAGSLTATTGILDVLTPPGSPVQGTIAVRHAAAVAGVVSPTDIDSVNISIGGFCVTTEYAYHPCPLQVQGTIFITSIDESGLMFVGGAPVGGTLVASGRTRSPWPVELRIDVDNETMLLDAFVWGEAVGVAQLTTSAGDTDADSLLDNVDNCTAIPNSDQADANADMIGDLCDADISGPGGIEDCLVNQVDLQVLRNAFLSHPGSSNWNAAADIDANGVVNFVDLGIVRRQFFGPPGPSAAGCN